MYTVHVDAVCNVHSHLREGEVVRPLVELAIRGGADVLLPMPNTAAGLTTAQAVTDYIRHARQCVPEGATMGFIPAVMVNEMTPLSDLAQCCTKHIFDAKVYPLDRTTKSHNGVRHYAKLLQLVKVGGEIGMRFHFHPEHPWMLFDSRDAEFAFLPLIDMLLNETKATIIWEHATDARCLPFWIEMAKSNRFFITITPHHLITHEDKVFGDVRAVCKPPIKTRRDQADLLWLVNQDYRWVMAGADDAPHSANAKHVHKDTCACGAYQAPFLAQLYAEVLGDLLYTPQGIQTFNNFVSRNAREFYQLPQPSVQLCLQRKPFRVPDTYEVGPWIVEPFFAGKTLQWSKE